MLLAGHGSELLSAGYLGVRVPAKAFMEQLCEV